MVCSSYGLDDENFDNEHLPSDISEHEQVSLIENLDNLNHGLILLIFLLISSFS